MAVQHLDADKAMALGTFNTHFGLFCKRLHGLTDAWPVSIILVARAILQHLASMPHDALGELLNDSGALHTPIERSPFPRAAAHPSQINKEMSGLREQIDRFFGGTLNRPDRNAVITILISYLTEISDDELCTILAGAGLWPPTHQGFRQVISWKSPSTTVFDPAWSEFCNCLDRMAGANVRRVEAACAIFLYVANISEESRREFLTAAGVWPLPIRGSKVFEPEFASPQHRGGSANGDV